MRGFFLTLKSIQNKRLNTSLFVYDLFKRAGMPIAHLDNTTTKKECASAAIIVIGDEILKGQIQDANTIFLTKVIY